MKARYTNLDGHTGEVEMTPCALIFGHLDIYGDGPVWYMVDKAKQPYLLSGFTDMTEKEVIEVVIVEIHRFCLEQEIRKKSTRGGTPQ